MNYPLCFTLMSLLDYDMSQVPELTVAPEGEYLLTITKMEEHEKDKSGNPYLMSYMSIDDQPNTPAVRHFIGLPGEGMDEEETNNRLRRLGYFLDAFDIQMPIDTSEMVSKQGSAILSIDPADGQYPESNSIKRFIAPK